MACQGKELDLGLVKQRGARLLRDNLTRDKLEVTTRFASTARRLSLLRGRVLLASVTHPPPTRQAIASRQDMLLCDMSNTEVQKGTCYVPQKYQDGLINIYSET